MLYDREIDPMENVNISNKTDMKGVVTELRKKLRKHILEVNQ